MGNLSIQNEVIGRLIELDRFTSLVPHDYVKIDSERMVNPMTKGVVYEDTLCNSFFIPYSQMLVNHNQDIFAAVWLLDEHHAKSYEEAHYD